jgi:hypothetical protein
MKRVNLLLTAVVLIGSLAFAKQAVACPFCSAVSQTLRQEMEVMDAIAIAEATADSVRDELTGQVKLKVISVLKGENLIKPKETITAVYYGSVEPGRRFMISGADPTNIQWACLPITDVSEKYLLDISKLPDDPLERLKFYQPYLQHPDGMLNRDAYDEFAITPYPVVQQLKPFMNRDELVSWIQEPELPADRKRLYLTMLGVCGDEKDVPMLQDMIHSTQASTRGGLDALIACYLILAGEKGLATIDDLFLKNSKAPYADTYAAIMAIRFHGTETDKIPRSALVQSLHHVLDRKDLADLVIPDLARWGDWSQVDRLVQLFIEAEKDNNWIRVPVVNYLRACPLPQAAEAIEKLKEVDPESVKRASSFFSIPVPTPAATPKTSFNATPQGALPPMDVPPSKRALSERLDRHGKSSIATTKSRKPTTIGNKYSDAKFASSPFVPRSEHAFAIAYGLKTPAAPVLDDANRIMVASVGWVTFASTVFVLYLILSGGVLSGGRFRFGSAV